MAASSDRAKWYVSSNNQRYGPYPASVLTDWVALQRIAADALVSDGGPWIPVKEFMRQQAAEQTTPQELEVIEPPPPVTTGFGEGERATAGGGGPEVTGPGGSVSQPVSAPVRREEPPPDDSIPERDRIVVIGRRQSGKTIYLASLYAKLWRSLNGMTAKAVSGEVHRQLMMAHQTLRRGEWPAATLGTSQIELEIDHAGKKRLMITLDFAGELFRKAFVEEQTDFPGVKELTNHIDRAAAVILLVDPSVSAGMDHEAAMDDDFGLVQAVQRIRNWPGGDGVPIVLALTKMDQYQHLLDCHGGSKGFVRHHFPALVRLLRHIPIFQVSAVQTDAGPDGRAVPLRDSQAVNIEMPLRYCIDRLDKSQEAEEQRRLEEQRAAYERRQEEEELARERRQNRVLIASLIVIFLAGAAGVTWVIMYKF